MAAQRGRWSEVGGLFHKHLLRAASTSEHCFGRDTEARPRERHLDLEVGAHLSAVPSSCGILALRPRNERGHICREHSSSPN